MLENRRSYDDLALTASLKSDVHPHSPPTDTDITSLDSRTDKQRQVVELLEAGVEGILTSEGFRAYLQTMAKFHRYSFANTLLIHAQNPEATHVAGYKKWQELGRQVSKGEKAIKIFVPYTKTITDPDDGSVTRRVTGFGIRSVFDVSQTDGEPLPAPPGVIESTEVSAVSREINKRLSRWGIDEGLLMESKEFPGHAKGYWNPTKRQVVIRRSSSVDEETGEENPFVDPLNVTKTKTLAHELGHYVAGHNGEIDRKDAEIVAEGSAFVTLKHFGLDTANYSFGYVSSWAGDMDRVRKNLSDVQRIANVLISAVEGTEPEDEPDLGP